MKSDEAVEATDQPERGNRAEWLVLALVAVGLILLAALLLHSYS